MAKLPKKQEAAGRFLDLLELRQDEFAAIEDSRALSIRRMLQRTKRRTQALIVEHQEAFAKSGKYLTGVSSLKQAQETAQDIDTLLRRDFMRTEDRLISFKEDAFKKGVWDFDVASQELPGNIKGKLQGTFSQIMPEAAYAAAEHPVMGIGPAMTFNGIQVGTEQRVRNVLTEAVLSGASIADTTALLNESLNVTVAAAERIARTSLNASYNEAHKMIYDANSDIFSGYRWDAVMDDRTSAICIMLHGQFWSLGDTPPGPPAHWNCRSILTPVFRDASLNRMMMNDTVRVRNYTKDGTEKIGWVRNKTSAQTWLRRQPTSVTRQITGSQIKNQLFRSGKIDMDDIVGPNLLVRTDKSVLRRAWSKNPTDGAIAKLAHANGVHKAPRWSTILKEDRALANKQSYDSGVSLTKAEAKAPSFETAKASVDQVDKWKETVLDVENDMSSTQATIKNMRFELRTATGGSKDFLTRRLAEEKALYVRLRNRKWRINKKIKQAGGVEPPPPPAPVIDPKIAKLEAAWQETVDELARVRKKLATARKEGWTGDVALHKKDAARLVNKRWRRWKRLPPDSQVRLKTGVKPVPVKPVPATVDAVTVSKEVETVLNRVPLENPNRAAGGLIQERARKQALHEAALGSSFDASTAKNVKMSLDKLMASEVDNLTARAELVAKYRKGWPVQPPVINQHGVIIDGHHRVASAIAAGRKDIMVIRVIEHGVTKPKVFRSIALKAKAISVKPGKLTSVQKFNAGVVDVEKLNKKIVALRDKATLSLGETNELKTLQASRTKAMNKLRALRRTDKKLPDLPDSVRLPKRVRPKGVPKPGAKVDPGKTKVQFSPETQKLQTEMVKLDDELQKLRAEYKVLRRKSDAAGRQMWRAELKTSNMSLADARAAYYKLDALEGKMRKKVLDLQYRARLAREAFQKKAVVERTQMLASFKKPKFMPNVDKAIARAKAELDGLGLDLATLRSSTMDPDDLLKLLSQANGQGPGVPLTSLRQHIYDNFADELKRLGQWTPKKKQKLRLMLTSMDERILKDYKLETIQFQHAPERRAFANRWNNNIAIKRGEATHTIAHEFGHHISYRNSNVHRRMVRWQRGRTDGERVRTIYTGTTEVGKRDKFWDKYVGRIYSDGFQEGLSMGLQTLFDPKSGGGWGKIIKKDSDHFYQMWAILRGY